MHYDEEAARVELELDEALRADTRARAWALARLRELNDTEVAGGALQRTHLELYLAELDRSIALQAQRVAEANRARQSAATRVTRAA